MEFYEHKIVSVEDLIPYALNSRTHSDAQVAQLAASIREFGFTNPILIDEQNNLIAGHGRLLAARKAKMESVPAVVVTGLDDRKRRALVIADNKLALNAGWDMDSLLVEMQDLGSDFGELMGFSEKELLDMFRAEEDQLPQEQELKATFEVAVECSDESEQETVFNLLSKKGYTCRILTM
jgi:ParB-like chromosome segregation protein Spo0J